MRSFRIVRSAACLAITVAACADDGVAGAGNGLGGDSMPPDGPLTPVDTDENYDCTGRVTGSFANVFVPPGESCALEGAVVEGNVLAREGSRLFVSDTDVAGNIDGVEARVVHVRGGRLEGSIQIQDGSSPGEVGALVVGTVLSQGNITVQKMRTGTIEVRDVTLVEGNVQMQENEVDTLVLTGSDLRAGNVQVQQNRVSGALDIIDNQVAQNVQVFVNDGTGVKTVTGNNVGQTLECKENRSPFTGGPNTAGEALDQCQG